MNIEYICFLQPYQILILNIIVPRYQTEYEYRIYSFLETSPNMNIEYIQCKLLMIPLHRKVHLIFIEYICCPEPDRIRILNIFGLSKLAEYEYQIYS